MDTETRAFMEPRFDADFSDVRIHTDSGAAQSAERFQADAYTTGRDIYFAAGKYAPSSDEGQRLIAHELTHTLQQQQSETKPIATDLTNRFLIDESSSDRLETEAEHTADKVIGDSSDGPQRSHPVFSASEHDDRRQPSSAVVILRQSSDPGATPSPTRGAFTPSGATTPSQPATTSGSSSGRTGADSGTPENVERQPKSAADRPIDPGPGFAAEKKPALSVPTKPKRSADKPTAQLKLERKPSGTGPRTAGVEKEGTLKSGQSLARAKTPVAREGVDVGPPVIALPPVQASPPTLNPPTDVVSPRSLPAFEAAEELKRGYDPLVAAGEVDTLLARFRSGAGNQKESLRQASDQAKGQIAAAGEEQKKAIQAQISEEIHAVKGKIRETRTALASDAVRTKAFVTVVTTTGFVTLLLKTSEEVKAINASAEIHKKKATDAVAKQRDMARKFGMDEGKRGKDAIDQQAKDARAKGQAKAGGYPAHERGQVQAEAVMKVAAEVAAKLAEPGDDLRSSLVDGGKDLADGIGDVDTQVAKSIDDQTPKFTADINDKATECGKLFGNIRQDVSKGVNDFVTETNQKLDEVELAITKELHLLQVTILAQIAASVRQLQTSIDSETEAAVTSIDHLVDETEASIRKIKRPHADGVRKSLEKAEETIDKAAAQFSDGLEGLADSSRNEFTESGNVVRNGIGVIALKVSNDLSKVTSSSSQTMETLGEKGEMGSKEINEEWSKSLAGAQQDIDAKYDEAVGGMEKEIEKGLTAGEVKLTAKVDEAISKNREPLDQLDTKLEEAAKEARDKYDAPWYEKVGSWLLHALGSFLKALGMLLLIVIAAIAAIVLIIVGIVFDLVVLIVIGVVALLAVVVYVLYGIVKNWIARVMSAETWWEAAWAGVVGLLDITGIPNVIEGIIQHDIINGRKLTAEEAGDRFGSGLLGVLLLILPLKAKGAPPPVEAPPIPVEVPVEPRLPTPVEPPPAPKPPEPPTPAPKPLEPPTPAPKPLEPPSPAPKPPEPPTPTPKPLEPPTPAPKPPEPPTPAPKPPEPKSSEPKREPEPPEQKFAVCFVAGTTVFTQSGPMPIEQLQVGQKLLGNPPAQTTALGPHQIVATYRGSTDTLVRISIDGSSVGSTEGHPFYVIGKGWVPAADLDLSDRLQGPTGEPVEIDSLDLEYLAKPVPTYNISLEDVFTYFVHIGGYAVLVHNNGRAFYDQILFWFFGKDLGKARVDPDGVSIWRTENAEEVRALMETRVNVMNRKANDPHRCWTQEQWEAELGKNNVNAPQTDGKGPIAEKLGVDHHHSVRTSDAEAVTDPANPPNMTETQQSQLAKNFQSMEGSVLKTPRQVETDFGGCG